jgi:DNA-binding response OmpR family regulator
MYRVGLIESDRGIRECLKLILQEEGYEVHAFAGPWPFLKALATTRFHLLIIDVVLPGLDGCALARLLRSNPETANIPILATTVLDHDVRTEESETCWNGTLEVPVRSETLLAAVRRCLNPASHRASTK